MITEHIALHEFWCKHCGQFPPLTVPSLTDENLISLIEDKWWSALQYLFSVFEDIREWWGTPITITSGYRCPTHQEELRKQGYKAAKVSAHQISAMDITTGSPQSNRKVYDYILENYPDLRVGFHAYNGMIIHIDTVFAAPVNELIDLGYLPQEVNGKHLTSYWRKGARW